MALGAQQDAVLRMILKKGLSLISAGILIGVLLSFGLTRFLVSQVWGVSVVDPWTFAAVVICVASVGLLACPHAAPHKSIPSSRCVTNKSLALAKTFRLIFQP
jgi:ABC-type antimicrobial peptide transport system permease subunit